MNRRFVYATRLLAVVFHPPKGFAVNDFQMPPIPRSAPYASHNKLLPKAAKQITSDAAKEVHVLKDKSEDDVSRR